MYEYATYETVHRIAHIFICSRIQRTTIHNEEKLSATKRIKKKWKSDNSAFVLDFQQHEAYSKAKSLQWNDVWHAYMELFPLTLHSLMCAQVQIRWMEETKKIKHEFIAMENVWRLICGTNEMNELLICLRRIGDTCFERRSGDHWSWALRKRADRNQIVNCLVNSCMYRKCLVVVLLLR